MGALYYRGNPPHKHTHVQGVPTWNFQVSDVKIYMEKHSLTDAITTDPNTKINQGGSDWRSKSYKRVGFVWRNKHGGDEAGEWTQDKCKTWRHVTSSFSFSDTCALKANRFCPQRLKWIIMLARRLVRRWERVSFWCRTGRRWGEASKQSASAPGGQSSLATV